MSRGRNGYPAWTREDDDHVREHWPRADMTARQIGSGINRTADAVVHRARALDLGRKPLPASSPNSMWSDERIEMLKAWWAEGKSAAEIAKELGRGVSRASVIGKAYRLGLTQGEPARKEVCERTASVRRARERAAAKLTPEERTLTAALRALKATKTEGPKEARPPRVPMTEQPVPPGANPRTLADLDLIDEQGRVTQRCCRWPVGPLPRIGEGHLQLFCAEAVAAQGENYCPAHTRRSQQKQRTPEQKAADAARAQKMRLAKGGAHQGPNTHAFLFAKRVA